MTFHEKLARLTEDHNRSKLSRKAGLPATAITSYLHKLQTPSAIVALRLARVLEVSIEWLIDDSQNWPPIRNKSRERVGEAA